MMELISVRQQILDAPENWRKMHLLPDGTWRGVQKKAVYDALMAMDLTTATAEKVHALGVRPYIWTPTCNECNKQFQLAISFGDDSYQWDELGAVLCLDCLRKAVALLESENHIPTNVG